MAKKRKNANYIGSKSYKEREAKRAERESADKRRKMTVLVSLILALITVILIPVSIVAGVKAYRAKDNKYVEIVVKDYGSIVVYLDAYEAPETVANFVKLAENGFYDNLTFHRANKTIIQGGDPLGTGSGGSPDKIKGEFSANGHRNNIEHERGVISMARSSGTASDNYGYDTASSQFFICVEDYPDWDGTYAAFGHVVEGMDVVDAINAGMRAKLTGSSETISKKADQPKILTVRVLNDYVPAN